MTDKINGRTPEEIKKGLECTITESLGLCGGNIFCENCECYAENAAIGIQAIADGLTLINQLMADNKQLEHERDEARRDADKLKHAAKEATDNYFVMLRERDAAVEQLRKGGRACSTCKFSEDIPENDKICEECRLTGTKLLYSNWEWVGPQEVE